MPAAVGGPTTARRGGIILEVDKTAWKYWWEVNKNPFIRLKEAIFSEGVETGVDLDRIEISEEVGERGAGRCVLGNPEAGNIHVAPTVPGIAEGVGRDAEVGLGNGHELAVGPFDRL